MRRRRSCGSVLLVLLLVTVVGVGLGALVAWNYWSDLLLPVDPDSDQAVIVQLPAGSSSRRIGQLLAEHGLIKHPLAFDIYVRYHNVAHKLRAGEYELSPSLSMPDIADRLARGQVVTYSLTIPEGYSVEQIIAAAADTGFFKAEDLRAALDEAAGNWQFLDAVDPAARDALREPLEGYLFPDTYVFTRSTTAEQLVSLMLRKFESVFTAAWQQRAAELNLSVHQIVTLASIVEREAQLAEERALVASVYHNRLGRGMKLDADPTVLYALGRYDGRLLYADLEVDSPFNTYRYADLPPGPIASPGAGALEAALYPAETDYLFFVSKFDGTGAHVFARTYNEHLANVRRYRP